MLLYLVGGSTVFWDYAPVVPNSADRRLLDMIDITKKMLPDEDDDISKVERLDKDENSLLFSLSNLTALSENQESTDIFSDSEIDDFVESGLVKIAFETVSSETKHEVPASRSPRAHAQKYSRDLIPSFEKEAKTPVAVAGIGVRRQSIEETMTTGTNWIKLNDVWTCIETGDQCGSVSENWTAAWCPTGGRWTCLRTGEQRSTLDVIGENVEWLQTGNKMTHVNTGLQIGLNDTLEWRRTGKCWTHVATGEQMDTLPEEIANLLDVRLMDKLVVHLSGFSSRLPGESGKKAGVVLRMLTAFRSGIETVEMPPLSTEFASTTSAEQRQKSPVSSDMSPRRPPGRQSTAYKEKESRPRKRTMIGLLSHMPVVSDEAIPMDEELAETRLDIKESAQALAVHNGQERSVESTANHEEAEAQAINYLKKAETADDFEEQISLLFKAGRIYEEICHDAEKAIELYRRILEIDEDDLRALVRLESLYLQQNRWAEMPEIYSKMAELIEPPEEKRQVLYLLGAVCERELGNVDMAIAAYQRIIELIPDDLEALQRLDVHYSEKEAWQELLPVLEREISLSGDPDEAASFIYRIGELYAQHLDDIPRSLSYFREVLALSPDHAPTIGALETLLHTEDAAMLTAEILAPIYQDEGEWLKLIEVMQIKLNHSTDKVARVELFHQIGGLLESKLYSDLPEEAFDVHARAPAEDPVNTRTLDKLEELTSQTGRWKELALLMDGLLNSDLDTSQAVLIGLKSGEIYEEKLNAKDEAIIRYKKVLELDDQNRQALKGLEHLSQIDEKNEG